MKDKGRISPAPGHLGHLPAEKRKEERERRAARRLEAERLAKLEDKKKRGFE